LLPREGPFTIRSLRIRVVSSSLDSELFKDILRGGGGKGARSVGGGSNRSGGGGNRFRGGNTDAWSLTMSRLAKRSLKLSSNSPLLFVRLFSIYAFFVRAVARRALALTSSKGVDIAAGMV
jgi:hypothetical protein